MFALKSLFGFSIVIRLGYVIRVASSSIEGSQHLDEARETNDEQNKLSEDSNVFMQVIDDIISKGCGLADLQKNIKSATSYALETLFVHNFDIRSENIRLLMLEILESMIEGNEFLHKNIAFNLHSQDQEKMIIIKMCMIWWETEIRMLHKILNKIPIS